MATRNLHRLIYMINLQVIILIPFFPIDSFLFSFVVQTTREIVVGLTDRESLSLASSLAFWPI